MDDKNACLDALVEHPISTRMPWIIEAPTLAGESIWGLSVYLADRYPGKPLPYKMTKRRVLGPQDNPRRINARWKKMMAAAS